MGIQIRPEAMIALGPAYTNFDLYARVERQIRTVGERWPVNNHDKSSVDVVHRAKPASRVCGKDQSKIRVIHMTHGSFEAIKIYSSCYSASG
jgi:hypothetical protein